MKKQADNHYSFFASCPQGWEALLERELEQLGASVDDIRVANSGVHFVGDLKLCFTVCLWSRLASKVLYPIASKKINDADDMYRVANMIEWHELLVKGASIRVDFIGTNDEIRNTQFGAQRVKDAIVDKLVSEGYDRPAVEKTSPDIRIHARLHRGELNIGIDLCGESLHKRGYRTKQGNAPLKENLAAALLVRSGWQKISVADKGKASLIDPMCGSGTLLIEGALMSLNIAPGLTRSVYAFEFWQQYDCAIWESILNEAKIQAEKTIKENEGYPIRFFGYDSDAFVVDAALANIQAVGLDSLISIEQCSVDEFVQPESAQTGLIITNPPYGERLGEVEALRETYQHLAQQVKKECAGWQFALFTSNPELARETRLRANKKNKFRNGALHAELFLYSIVAQDQSVLREGESQTHKPEVIFKETSLNDDGQMVKNRLMKNIKRLKPFVRSKYASCYRIYDADMPEYSAAVDMYNDCVHIQEYAAPKTIDPGKAQYRFTQLKHAVAVALNLDNEKLFVKTRRKNKGDEQYQNQTDVTGFNKDRCMQVVEGDAKFYVNLNDFIDTGLFLDHRPLRKKIHDECDGKRFLNLFCYTASVSVQAALGGASETVSVDMSNTYLDWAEENFRLNNLRPEYNTLERADCFEWLKTSAFDYEKFDIILLDPPTFSNSKKMEDVLDVQRDHVQLIDRCMRILNDNGAVYFSTNFKKFKLDAELDNKYSVKNITHETQGVDFKQNPKIHYSWIIKSK